jgi:hypothetical protein
VLTEAIHAELFARENRPVRLTRAERIPRPRHAFKQRTQLPLAGDGGFHIDARALVHGQQPGRRQSSLPELSRLQHGHAQRVHVLMRAYVMFDYLLILGLAAQDEAIRLDDLLSRDHSQPGAG